jgi:hypothetical protein
MHVERSRREFLAGAATLALMLATRTGAVARAEPLPEVTVYKTPT